MQGAAAGLSTTVDGIVNHRPSKTSGVHPRVLVCAPSNTAANELLRRITGNLDVDHNAAGRGRGAAPGAGAGVGLLNSDGQPFCPSVVRIGSARSQAKRQDARGGDGGGEGGWGALASCSLEAMTERRVRNARSAQAAGGSGAGVTHQQARAEILQASRVIVATLSGAGSQVMVEAVLEVRWVLACLFVCRCCGVLSREDMTRGW